MPLEVAKLCCFVKIKILPVTWTHSNAVSNVYRRNSYLAEEVSPGIGQESRTLVCPAGIQIILEIASSCCALLKFVEGEDGKLPPPRGLHATT